MCIVGGIGRFGLKEHIGDVSLTSQGVGRVPSDEMRDPRGALRVLC